MRPVDAGGMAIDRFRKQYHEDLDNFIPEEYVKGAEPVLTRMGWLARPLDPMDYVAAILLVQQASGDGMSIDDYPFLLLWALLEAGAIREVPGLRYQLLEWRAWWEAEYDEVLGFLPPLWPRIEGGDT